MVATGIAGLVLAGGQSRRFGADKADAMLGGRPLAAWSLAALQAACDVVALSAARDASAIAPARPIVTDLPTDPPGPLAGVAAGLRWAAAGGFDRLVTLPCDTPLVKHEQIAILIAALDGHEAAYATTPEGPQPLCCVWRTRLAARLASSLAGGDHPSVRDFLAWVEARAVLFSDARSFANVNTLADLARLERDLQ